MRRRSRRTKMILTMMTMMTIMVIRREGWSFPLLEEEEKELYFTW